MADNPGNGKDRKIFQQMDVRATTKNSITIGWKLSKSNGTLGRMILRGYTVKYHAVGSTIKHDVDSLGPSLVTYVIKHLHENTIYEICVRALMKFSDDVETIHEGMDSSDRQSALIPQGSVDYSPAVHKSSNDIHLIQEPNNDSDTFPGRSSEVLSTSSSPGHSLELPGVKNLDSGYESCIVSSTASSSLSLALGSTLGAFLALGVIVFFVLVAKWQHKNRRQRLKKRWIASNISASERSQRLTFNPELLQMDDLISCDPCDVGNGPWSPDEIDVKEVDRARDNLESDEIELNALDLDGDLLLLDETDHQDGCDLQTRRSKEAIDALRRILQDENICAESFVISTPSVKDGSESYNLLVPLSSAQSLLPYLVDNEDEEFPVSTQNRHHYHQNRSAGNSRMAESVRKLKFKKHFTIDYSGCSSELHPDQKGCLHLDNALQQQVNCSFAAKQSRLFKLQTLKTVECNSSLDTDYDDCPDKPISESHSNGEHSMQSEDAKDRLCFVNEQGNNDNNVHQQDYPMQPDTTENGEMPIMILEHCADLSVLNGDALLAISRTKFVINISSVFSLAKVNYKSYRKVCPSSYADPTLFANQCQRRKGVGHFLSNKNINSSNNTNVNNIGASSIDDFKHETVGKKGAGIFLESVRITDPIPARMRPYLCTYRTPGPLVLNCKEMERICKEQKYKGIEELEQEEKTCLENKLEKIEELEQCRGLWQDLRTQQDCMADDSKCEELRKYHARQELFPYGRLNNEAEMRLLHKMSKAAENRNVWKEQMKERQEILQHWKEEDWRLDAETEKLRLAAVGSEEEVKARKRKELMIGLVNQINCKKLEKIEAAEIKHMEGEAMRKCWEKLNEEEFDKITGGSGNRRCYKDQLDICMLQKTKKKIEDDATERALLERINRIRKELDEKTDVAKENRQQHIEMQQKIADLLRCRLEVVMDKQTEAEVKRIQRSMEQADKDFMRRELEDESKRKEIEYLVKKGRDCQIQTKRELQAIEATRDKLYFESDLRRLIKDMEFERGSEGRKQKRKEYGNVLKQQMCDNEQLRKEFMSEKYKYGREMAEKECMRRKLIEGEMDKKFSCLREKGVPEQFIKKITGKITEEFKGEKFTK